MDTQTIIDYARCQHDIAFFCKLVTGFELYEHQIDLLRASGETLGVNDKNSYATIMPRRAGLTTAMASIAAHDILFSVNKMTVYRGHNAVACEMFITQVADLVTKANMLFSDVIPATAITRRDRHKLNSEAKSYVLALSGSVEKFRGLTVDRLLIDNGFKNEREFDTFFMGMLPAISANNSIIMGSSGYTVEIHKVINDTKQNRFRTALIKGDLFYSDGYLELMKEKIGEENYRREFCIMD